MLTVRLGAACKEKTIKYCAQNFCNLALDTRKEKGLMLNEMIWESRPWKKSLLRQATKFKAWNRFFGGDEEDLFKLEKEAFFAVFTIRKLFDAKKCSTLIMESPIECISYPAKGEPVTLLNWHKINKLYHLNNGKRKNILIRDFCNLLIHSYVFFYESGDDMNNLHSLIFSSDRTRNKCLYEVPVGELIRVLRLVGNDYPNSVSYEFNEFKKDFDVLSCKKSVMLNINSGR